RARAPQDGVEGQGRASSAADRCAPRAEEALERGHSRAVREEPAGKEGERVLREVPGARGAVGSRGRGRLPSDGCGSFMIERRRFLAKASGAAAVAAATIVDAPNVISQPKIQWRMSTAYPASSDIVHGAALRLAQIVEEVSGGRFRIEGFPGGQIIPSFEGFDAASKGTIEAFMAVPPHCAEPQRAPGPP